MATKRMFSLEVVDTDKFLDMPVTTQALYFHLGMRADDEGFISSPKRIIKSVNCNEDDFKLLIAKGYLIPFEEGVVVISDWNVNNWIRPDRKHETRFLKEKEMLEIQGGVYTLNANVIPTDNQLTTNRHTEISIDKISIDKISIDKGSKIRFTPPTPEDVRTYCQEKGYDVDEYRFVDFYEAKGWMIGKNKMKDWKAAVRTWVKRDSKPQMPVPEEYHGVDPEFSEIVRNYKPSPDDPFQ